jgi:hypothetical protein
LKRKKSFFFQNKKCEANNAKKFIWKQTEKCIAKLSNFLAFLGAKKVSFVSLRSENNLNCSKTENLLRTKQKEMRK